MICKLIRPALGANPAAGFDGRPAIVTFPDGSRPTAEMPPIMTFPAGTTLEHIDCWQHCVYGDHNVPPIAVPVDEECKRIVRTRLERRETDIQAIRETALELGGSGPAGKFMQGLAKSYGVDE